MDDTGTIGFLLLILNFIVSYKGFKDDLFFEDNLFHVDKILIAKERKRMITSGFLHGSWWHLIFNMLALTSFASYLEITLNPMYTLIIYFLSLIGGSLLSLYVHRNHGDYTAVGASGAVFGIVYASIVLNPDGVIKFILLPIEFKSWVLGIIFILVSIFGIKSQKGNIGHEAHLGGAIVGMIVTLMIRPSLFETHYITILLLLIPSLLFLYLIVRNPNILILENYWGEGFEKLKQNIKEAQTPTVLSREEELNTLLDKIKKTGFNNLSTKEKKRLKELSDE